MQRHIFTDVDGVAATIRTTDGGYVVLELSGNNERFGSVSVEDIAASYGYEVDDVISESIYLLA